MQNRKIIRILIAVIAAVSVFVAIRWATLVIIQNRLGNSVYAVDVAMFSILPIVASLAFFWLLLPRISVKHEENAFETEDSVEDEAVSQPVEIQDIDESVYPELFNRKAETTESEIVSYPDIKRIIGEQKSDVFIEDTVSQNDYTKLWEEYVGEKSEESPIKDLYRDIPAELPVGYEPPSLEEDETEIETDDSTDEENEHHDFRMFFIKLAAALILAVLAVVIPVSNMTVYTPSGVKDYKLFGVMEYEYKHAIRYNVGVSLSGGLSVKVQYDDGGEYELIFDADLRSNSFDEKFTSEYGYATFCDRLFKQMGVQKNVENLSALSRIPDGALPYVEEITEGYSSNG